MYDKFISPISEALRHRTPLLFVRGNHEARGPGARLLMEAMPIPERRCYYTRDHGPLHMIVLDTGEDKDDATNVYARLNAFKAYREEDLAWFREQARSSVRLCVPFRVLLMHAPNWGWAAGRNEEWTAAANDAGIDLSVSGHTHRFSHSLPGQRGKSHHELVIAPDQLATIDATPEEMKIVVTGKDGAVVESFSVAAKKR
jgi:hypothetical protein